MTPGGNNGIGPDHDLLVQIVVEVKYLRADLDSFKRDIASRLEAAEKAIAELRISRAQLYAAVATISATTGVLIKAFWPH